MLPLFATLAAIGAVYVYVRAIRWALREDRLAGEHKEFFDVVASMADDLSNKGR